MNNLELIGFYKSGNKIYIKPENRGKFTKSAKAAGKSVQEHARDVLANPNATPLQKKRANFAQNSKKWKHENGAKIHKPWNHRSILDNDFCQGIKYKLISKNQEGGILKCLTGNRVNYKTGSPSNDKSQEVWSSNFLDKNREQLNTVLSKVDHKRGLLNVLLNEGYVDNMINTGLVVEPDSAVVARNPVVKTKIPTKRGNFGLDNIQTEAPLFGIDETRLSWKKPWDNIQSLYGADKLSLNEAASIINQKLNTAKKALYDKYGSDVVSAYFRANPGYEDRILYAAYKMPNKFKARVEKHPTIEKLFNQYIDGGLNKSFSQVDRYQPVINKFFGK